MTNITTLAHEIEELIDYKTVIQKTNTEDPITQIPLW